MARRVTYRDGSRTLVDCPGCGFGAIVGRAGRRVTLRCNVCADGGEAALARLDTARVLSEIEGDEQRARPADAPAEQPAVAAADGRAELLAEIGERLGAPVADVQVWGAGLSARVHLALADGRTLRVERFEMLAAPSRLAALAATVGIARTFRGADAQRIAALIGRVATLTGEAEDEGLALSWATEYLRAAAVEDADLRDQAGRWQAFSRLAAINPAAAAGDRRDHETYAACTVVLRDTTSGIRYVRAGWLQGYVSRRPDGAGYSPAAVASLMLTAGWRRTGRAGRIKASQPGGTGRLAWSFLLVPPDWEAGE